MEPIWNDKFLSSLSENPVMRVYELCKRFRFQSGRISASDKLQHHDAYVDAYAALSVAADAADMDVEKPDLKIDPLKEIVRITEYCNSLYGIVNIETAYISIAEAAQNYEDRFGGLSMYEFTEGEVNRIQELINELHDEICASDKFEKEHKERLLKRLVSLEREAHKKISTLEQFGGLMGDANVVLPKLGKDAKPFTDLILKLAAIAWSAEARA